MIQENEFFARSLSVFALAFLVACGPSSTSPTEETSGAGDDGSEVPSIYVVNYPLQYFAKRIVGDRAQVVLPGSSGSDPAFWKPSEEEIVEYQKADLILLWGADFAKWIEGVSLPSSRVVDTGAAIRDQFIYEENAVVHSHGDSPEHSHGSIAFTSWLDFELMVLYCRQLKETLSQRFPANANAFAEAFRSLESDLREIDRQFKAAIPQGFEETLFASHPIYQYFERRYGVNLHNFHWEPGETPSDAEWQKFEEQKTQSGARWMLWEGVPSEETDARMKALGVTPILFPVSGGLPASGDFLSIMKDNAERLAKALQAP